MPVHRKMIEKVVYFFAAATKSLFVNLMFTLYAQNLQKTLKSCFTKYRLGKINVKIFICASLPETISFLSHQLSFCLQTC